MSVPVRVALAAALLLAPALPVLADDATPSVTAASPADAGRYLIVIGGCNDCHTAGWVQHPGEIPEKDWLKGIPVGWHSPAGTAYAANLRLMVSDMTVDDWKAHARSLKSLPPMPAYILNDMSDKDLEAIYAFLVKLGPDGDTMPTALAAGVAPTEPAHEVGPQPPK